MKAQHILLGGVLACAIPVLCAWEGTPEGSPPEQGRKAGQIVAQLDVSLTHVYGYVYDRWFENGDAKTPVVPSWQVDDRREDSKVIQFVKFTVPAKGRLFLEGVLKADAKYTFFLWGDYNPSASFWDPAQKLWWPFPSGPANWNSILLNHGARQSELKLGPSYPTGKPAGGLLPNEGAVCEPGKYRLVVKAPRAPGGQWRYPMSGMLRVWFVPDAPAQNFLDAIDKHPFDEKKRHLLNRLRSSTRISGDEKRRKVGALETEGAVFCWNGKVKVYLRDSKTEYILKPNTHVIFSENVEISVMEGNAILFDKAGDIFVMREKTDVFIEHNLINVLIGNTWIRTEKDRRSGELIIKTAGSVCIRGTEIVVSVKKDGASTFIVIEGLVEVSDLGGTKTVRVQKGESSTISRDSLPTDPEPAKYKDKWWEDEPYLSNISLKDIQDLPELTGIFEPEKRGPGTVPPEKGNTVSNRADGILSLPFTDDFSDGTANWDISGATPEKAEGKLVWNTGNFASASPKVEMPVENIVVEFDGWTETNGFNVFLWNSEGKGYTVIIGGWSNTKSGSDVGGSAENRETVDGPVFTAGAWNHYKIVRQADTLAAYCNGKLVFSRTSSTRFSGAGRLRINSWMSRLGIDNIRISRADGGGR